MDHASRADQNVHSSSHSPRQASRRAHPSHPTPPNPHDPHELRFLKLGSDPRFQGQGEGLVGRGRLREEVPYEPSPEPQLAVSR